MLPGQKELSRLLGSLYDAASDVSLWDAFLQQLARDTGAHSSALVIHNHRQKLSSLSSTWGVDPEASDLYQKHYGSVDLWAQRAISKGAGITCTSESLCARDEIVRTEICNDYLVRYGFFYGMFRLVENDSACLASISLFRDPSGVPFEGSDLEILDLLGPHLQRALKLHSRFSELNARSEGLETALERLGTAVVFFGDNGEIVCMNRSASDLIGERDGLVATRDGLRAERPEESAVLQKVVLDAVSTSNGVGLQAGRTVTVSRHERPPLQVQISPVRRSALPLSQSVAAIAFVIDPARRHRPTSEVLRATFGLTAAECRVALLLVDGHTPRLIAQMLGVTDHTVRSQIKSIFSKTGVRRQSALVRLMLQSAV